METKTKQHTPQAVRKIISRACSICGKKMTITVFEDRSYTPGNYFFKMRIRGKNAEYWECDTCFNDQSF